MKTKLYTTSQAAELLGLTDGRIRQICRANSIGEKRGRDWFLTAREVTSLMKSENRKKSLTSTRHGYRVR